MVPEALANHVGAILQCPITRAVMRIAVNRGAAMAGYSNPTLEVPILFAPDRTTTTDEDCFGGGGQ